jgi:hypothetical protein
VALGFGVEIRCRTVDAQHRAKAMSTQLGEQRVALGGRTDEL